MINSSMVLPNTSQHQTLIVTTCLASDTLAKTGSVSLLVGLLHILEVLAVPMRPDDLGNQQLVLCAHASHGVLQKLSLVHVLVCRVPKLEKQGGLHMTRELLNAVSVGIELT
jgi:hypothetical protein